MALAAGLYLLFAINFSAYRVFGDGVLYYDFMRRFFGQHVVAANVYAYAYAFGVDLWNAWFWGLSQAAIAVTGHRTVAGFSLGEVAITIASNAAVALSAFLGWRLLRRIGLPTRASVLLAVIFGTPLYYYATFSPSYPHAADALALTLAATLLLDLVDGDDSTWKLLALGACLGWLTVIRYIGFALWPGLLLPVLACRGPRRAAAVTGAAIAATGLLFLLPVLRGIPYGTPQTHPATALNLDLLAPLKMLFSLHRGLFLWTPLTAISAIGIGLLIARLRGPHRIYVIGLATASLLLVAAYATDGNWWDGGWSFSQRYLTCLFPVFLLGFAEALRRWRWLVGILGTLAVLWSVFIGFNHAFGIPQSAGVNGIVQLYTSGQRTPHDFFHLFVSYSRFHHAF